MRRMDVHLLNGAGQRACNVAVTVPWFGTTVPTRTTCGRCRSTHYFQAQIVREMRETAVSVRKYTAAIAARNAARAALSEAEAAYVAARAEYSERQRLIVETDVYRVAS